MSKLRVGNYIIGKLLGCGNFAVVRHGTNVNTKHEVAVKIVSKKKLRKLKMKESLQREITFSRLFDHPHIIKTYEYLNSKDDIFVVSEYASRGELFDYVSNQGCLSESIARKFFQQIVYAIDYIHMKGVAHRDLKLENILLDENFNIKLGDFGLSNKINEGQALLTSCGTPYYAAPEILLGNSYDGRQVDIWSCGVILYTMLYGEIPFDTEKVSKIAYIVCKGKYKMKNTISQEAQDLINRMLQPDPFLRITINDILIHPWFCIDIPRYLINSVCLCPKNQIVDYEILQQMNDKNFINEQDVDRIAEEIELSLINNNTVHYHLLLRSKVMKEISIKSQNRKTLTFSKKNLGLNTIKSIQYTNKTLQSFSKNTKLNYVENKIDSKVRYRDSCNSRLSLTNSTNSLSCEDSLLPCSHSKFGLVYAQRLEDLFDITFKLLKEMNIVWKRCSSDYMFKCKSSTPTREYVPTNQRNEDFTDSIKSGCIKFYLQFTKNQSQVTIDSSKEINYIPEYCISFIWDDHSVFNFLDFISVFKTSLNEHI